MNPPKVIGAAALVLLLLTWLGIRYIAAISQDDWPVLWTLAFIVAGCAAFFAAFSDRKNFPEKKWDFNPRRGVLYFFLGWVIFPLMIALDALARTALALDRILLGTLAMPLLRGIAGTFTENPGV